MFLLFGDTKLDIVFQMWSNENRINRIK